MVMGHTMACMQHVEGIGSDVLQSNMDALKNIVHSRDWGQEKKGMTEDEMSGWHH